MADPNDIYVFLVRRYDTYADMSDYARIDCDLCGSVEETADAIVEYLMKKFDENDEPPLSEKNWQAVRARLITSDIFDGGEITLNDYPQFRDRTVPQSLRVGRVRLSDSLIARVRISLPSLRGRGPDVWRGRPMLLHRH